MQCSEGNGENAGGNDTVPISARAESMHSMECCCSRWLFIEYCVLKWSVRPILMAF